MSASIPVAYQQALDQFTTTLNSGLADEEVLNAALVVVMEQVRAARGALFVKSPDGIFAVRAARGLPPGAPSTLDLQAVPEDLQVLEPEDEVHVRHGLAMLFPILFRARAIAVLGLGPRAGGLAYGEEERAFLRSVAASAATPIESGLIRDELLRANQKLSVKVFQLRNLFDIGRELNRSFEEEAIQGLVITTAMGHFVVSRCALYLLGPGGLALVHERGIRRVADEAPIPPDEVRAALPGLEPREVAELPPGPLRRRLEEARLALAVPLAAGARVEGLLAIGERASRMPFSEEDRDFAQTLARQALAALENARLSRLRVEKQRRDRELEIAREIQRGLFPPHRPAVPGFEVAAESRSCYEVGGDSYDWIPLEGERLALVIADVSGKGTPASLLMASVQAFTRALAGTAPPAQVLERLNRFLFASTQANRFVTFFYAELDAAARQLVYVNAGHVPPFHVKTDGTVSRLREGGPALGLLEAASYEVGQVRLEAGDTVALVTDGVTEANSPDEREFGDERVVEALRALSGGGADAVLAGLVAAVDRWADDAGCSDDLTALILKSR